MLPQTPRTGVRLTSGGRLAAGVAEVHPGRGSQLSDEEVMKRKVSGDLSQQRIS